MSSDNRLNVYLFGFPHMERYGRAVEVDTRKALALMAYLAVTRELVSRDSLAALLWPDYDQTSARAALRRTLSVLNKAVGEGCLEIERERVRINPESSMWVDVTTFEQGLVLADSQQQSGNPMYLQNLVDAIHLARDHFMAGFSLRDSVEFDDWQFYQGERIGRDLANALHKLVLGYSQNGSPEMAIDYAHQWLKLDPLREEAHRQLMILYAQTNQRSAALRQYRECVRILDQELGVAPLGETTELYQAILENRLPISKLSFGVSHSQNREGIFQNNILKEINLPSEIQGSRFLPLVGRVWDWDALRAAYEHARTDGRIVVLEGEAGIGKTRLAEDFVRWATGQGALTLQMRCYEGETGLAYGPFVEALTVISTQPESLKLLKKVPTAALAEVARLSPEIKTQIAGLQELSQLEGRGAQSRFFESLREVIVGILAGPQPGILLIDDIQWADSASQDLLAYLIHRLSGSRLMFLITFRSDIPLENPHLSTILTGARRNGILTRRMLNRLGADDITRLVESFPNHDTLPGDLSERLYRETEGLPFFAVEYLDSIMTGGEWDLPASVRDLLLQRLSSVNETARQLLSTAAVIGHSFDFSVLREVSGRSELEAVIGLEALLASDLIIERREGGEQAEIIYDFTHEKLRSLVYEETSLARRRLLHRRVAEVLAGPSSRREPGASASVIAYHFHMAGQDLRSAEYYSQAGDYARSLYANAEALAHYQSALAAGHPEPGRLHEIIGDLHTLRGEYNRAIASYETAAAMAKVECPIGLEHKLGNVHARLGDWELAISHYQRAIEEGDGECSNIDQAGIFADWSQAEYQLNRDEHAQKYAQEAFSRAEFSGDSLALAQSYNVLGILSRRKGNLQESQQFIEKSLQAAMRSANPVAQIAAMNNLARVYLELDRLEEAIDINEQALKLCIQIGDRHREAALRNNLADLFHAAGDKEQAMAYLKQAVKIFSEIGVDAGGMNPEIWKLVEW